MAKLSKKELKLLALFAGTVFFAVNVMALKGYVTSLRAVRADLAKLTLDRQNIDGLLSDRDYWRERQRWLDAHEPNLDNVGAAQGELIQTLQSVARDRGITILDQTILEPVFQSQYQEIAAKFKLTAAFQDMVGWLADIQAPERFYIVNQLQLSIDTRSQEEDPPAICTIQVGRVYSPTLGKLVPPPYK
ncbi:MAG: GspMb/PilO family protein [Verrucomicrobiota bacterium]